MVGDDGVGNQIGMAPDGKWIGCRNMDEGYGTPTTYSECFQFFLAPTDLTEANPNPALAPDAINNSWGCPPSEGCTDPNVLRTIVDNTRAAGIVPVVSAGNYGSACGTVRDPPAIYDASLTVGSTTSTDAAAVDSSRGPVTVDGSNRLKPDVAAPGVGVRSSVPGGYAYLSGTSMAGPHVAGLVALVISANPVLAGRVGQIERIVRRTAVPLGAAETCGGLPAGAVPNNTFGYGRIDALAATQAAADWIFADGFDPHI
jgi:subtilisin family serine protease